MIRSLRLEAERIHSKSCITQRRKNQQLRLRVAVSEKNWIYVPFEATQVLSGVGCGFSCHVYIKTLCGTPYLHVF